MCRVFVGRLSMNSGILDFPKKSQEERNFLNLKKKTSVNTFYTFIGFFVYTYKVKKEE
jgi:hypothetical protein